jgi:hypothetical protein
MSFRTRVLDALDIQKKSVKLQVNERFPKIYSEGEGDELAIDTSSANDMVDYVVSKQIIGPETIHETDPTAVKTVGTGLIGPNVGNGTATYQTLDVLGFVVGQKPGDGGTAASIGGTTEGNVNEYKNTFPQCLDRSADSAADRKVYTGFHHLNGIYDDKMHELRDMRKSALAPHDLDSIHGNVAVHTHKDWPDNVRDQFQLLQTNPWADCLYYSAMKLQFLLTGITIPGSSEKASNHRGLVRMLVLKPKMPSIKVRFTGDANCPVINMAYPPHFDTDLFHTKTKTLAGRMDRAVQRDTLGGDQDLTHITPEFGLLNRGNIGKEMDVLPESIHYGHYKPSDGTRHHLNSFDVITSPINRKAYTVLEDKTFTLDTVHHGAASTRLETVTIPFNKKLKFAGRLPNSDPSVTALTENTNNEPLNLHSRPIVMFLSMDQKISCQVTGYTGVHEC